MIGVAPSWPWSLGLGVLCGVAGFRLGWRSQSRLLLPILQGGMGFLAFVYAWMVAGPVAAVIAEAGWALGTTAASIPVFRRSPAITDQRVFRAVAYRASMLAWLKTGRGPETQPLATILAHGRELVLYVLSALLTANALAIVLGAVLLNYMNAYVARLLRAARRPWIVRLLAWNVWSAIRVAGYLLLGAAAAGPLLRGLVPSMVTAGLWPLAVAGGAAVVLDLALKLTLSRPCGHALGAAVDLDAAAALE